ncbi:gluconate 2-dehydrogenase subunit 3 family protein [Pedobacter sp. Leaf170]|uniref:gluconate 2-dehydrogenase subunit 3 family protein n=1 Tax=Pedobacter sp. Leaf170 TaxID=2876558 RepID=UPI001E483E5C|nr:gluconate 2-dehydrogenase subunit 3 family protein [Pedobacter sp. Leaf170]
MNRRVSIKYALGLGLMGIFSFSTFEWRRLHKTIDLKSLQKSKTLISELAETIIPETDTPGAARAGVSTYIINILSNCSSVVEQNRFLNGLQEVESYALTAYDNSFIDCSANERIEILNFFKSKDEYIIPFMNRVHKKVFGPPFFTSLKRMTVEGYCMSELGATQGLAFNFVPGRYNGCTVLQRNQKAWATK